MKNDLNFENDWVSSVLISAEAFIQKLKSSYKPGFYKYSLSGDIYDETTHWGLGNSIFAAKALYTLGALNDNDKSDIANFILSFQSGSGSFFDPLVAKKSRLERVLRGVKNLESRYFTNTFNINAETRQAFATLFTINYQPNLFYSNYPTKERDIKKFIHNLDWKTPWAASAHVSHLIFFNYYGQRFFDSQFQFDCHPITIILSELRKYVNPDGSWYEGNQLPDYQKVNSAMKILTGLDIIKIYSIVDAEHLIDLCLNAINDEHACNHLNVIKVLYSCNKISNSNYRYDEIAKYCRNRLLQFEMHYWPKEGGFSFFQRKSNSIYYSAKITKGLPEPDIHGTLLFIWGISMISEILQLPIHKSFLSPIV